MLFSIKFRTWAEGWWVQIDPLAYGDQMLEIKVAQFSPKVTQNALTAVYWKSEFSKLAQKVINKL